MRLFVDSADRAAIQRALGTGFVTGVTTNPTLLRRAGVPAAEVPDLARQALEWGAREVHLQVFADDADGMLEDARRLSALDPARVLVKIPATPNGFRAAARLAEESIPTTLTAVYTLRQAALAQSVGARYVAIYLGRMRDAGTDALAFASKMQMLLDTQQAGVTILAASVRDPEEIVDLSLAGIGSATLPPAVIDQLLQSDATAGAAAAFSEDARVVMGGWTE